MRPREQQQDASSALEGSGASRRRRTHQPVLEARVIQALSSWANFWISREHSAVMKRAADEDSGSAERSRFIEFCTFQHYR